MLVLESIDILELTSVKKGGPKWYICKTITDAYVLAGLRDKYCYLHPDGVWRRSLCHPEDDTRLTGYYATKEDALASLAAVGLKEGVQDHINGRVRYTVNSPMQKEEV